MTNDQTENLEAFDWFNQLIELNEPTELFNKLALNLQNKAQNKAASCLLANVYLFAQDPETHYITISLRPATYTKDRYHSNTVGYRPFVTKVLPQFEKLKLIKLAKIGMSERDDCWGIVFRRRSRYLPTRKLLKVLASHNVNIDDIDIGSPEIIRLRVKKAKKDYRAKEKQQPKGQLIEYADTEHTRQLRGWPTQYNSFVQSFSIGLPDSLEPANRSATSFYRVFNVDFKKGGRLVGHWIFNIKRKDRHRLILNGEQATELDYKSMYAHLLYSLAGFNYHDLNHDGDPYLLENFDRALGKWGFHVALNSRKTRGFPRALKNRLGEDGRSEEALRGFNGAHLLHEILQKHKPVERLLFNQTNGNRCAYLDSMLIQNVLSHYLDWKVPVLPMHDGVITTVSERDRLKGVMEHEAERFLKSVPVVEIEY